MTRYFGIPPKLLGIDEDSDDNMYAKLYRSIGLLLTENLMIPYFLIADITY